MSRNRIFEEISPVHHQIVSHPVFGALLRSTTMYFMIALYYEVLLLSRLVSMMLEYKYKYMIQYEFTALLTVLEYVNL